MENFTQFTGVGVAGLAVYLMWKMNHTCALQMNKTLQELRLAIMELSIYLQKNDKQIH